MHKNIVRFTFDCPAELHMMAKMKAASSHQSVKEYLVGLLTHDIESNPPKFLNSKELKKELNKLMKEDNSLMEKLAKR